jgi:HTH-type transcriptional repressor of NAD biosynthesis genes
MERQVKKMTKAFILMTALPPTKGHRNLIRFGASLRVPVEVIVCTQNHEPYAYERFEAIKTFVDHEFSEYRATARHLHQSLQQDPEAPGFWDMWVSIMKSYGAEPGVYYVTSEAYGKTMAEKMDGIFMPYDPERKLYYTKATRIREDLPKYFHDILPEFQHNLRTNVVVFGAESTGKTTLSEKLSDAVNGHWLFEWARPYLETAGPEINIDSMKAIWRGQRALQDHSKFLYDKPFAIFDTDLFSTVGYWEQPHWSEALGPVPEQLVKDALERKADLYIITKSNIPFEVDPIRYGGDRRESPDEFWIGIAEKYDLNYLVLEESALEDRVIAAMDAALWESSLKARTIEFEREHND